VRLVFQPIKSFMLILQIEHILIKITFLLKLLNQFKPNLTKVVPFKNYV